MSNFVGLGTALSGLRAAQLGLDVSSQNVANANTAGYTRQRISLVSAPTYDSAVGRMGTGVQVDGIDRTRDAFLDRRLRLAVSDRDRDGLRADLLGRAEGVLAEPDLGISSELGVLWDSFEELGIDPSDGAARSQVLGALERVAGRIRDVASGWGDLADDTALRMRNTASEVNRLASRLAVLNGEIPVATRLGGSPNGLHDERDLLLDRLASLSGASATAEADGTVTVTVGGETVVRGTSTWAVSTTDDGTVLVAAGVPPTPRPVTAGGELGGASIFLRTELPAQRAALDELAVDLAESLAAVHGTGRHADGTAGGQLLDASGGAAGLQVHADVRDQPDRLAPGASGQPHDGGVAEALALLRSEPAPPRAATVDQGLGALVVSLGGAVQRAQREGDAAEGLALAAQGARSSAHGVSIDEEMVDIVRYQRSLEALARVMTAIDQALDTLINRTGLVGR